MNYSIETKQLRKAFTSVKKVPGVMGSVKGLFSREKTEKVAVSGLDLEIRPGEFVGFLGPNGAGKTTTIKMLTGIIFPTSGEASVLGFKPSERSPDLLRQIALVMGNRQQLWWDLPARESFTVLQKVYDVPYPDYERRLARLVRDLDLEDKLDQQVRKMSLGERMKCELVAAMLHNPKVVFLDEPTIGLDVVSQQRIRAFLKEFNQAEGCTVVLTSHYMQDVEELCDRVVVINHGDKVYDGTLAALKGQYAPSRRVRVVLSGDAENPPLPQGVRLVESDGPQLLLDVPAEQVARITGQLLQELPVADLSLEEVDIEEIISQLFADSRPNVSRETLAEDPVA
ncbi:MAG: ATP-binding cassette domain-containing protein [Fimbriimonadaceae bacterium]|nr:ATP-binding cassette domain-containing protein [Fimbriimonadaceae bacterium]